MDDLVGVADPVVGREYLYELLLDFLWSFRFGETEAATDTQDVGVDDDAFGFVEADAEDDIGGFASGTGDGDEFGEGFGDLRVEIGDEFAGRALERFCLVAEEAGGADEGFELGECGPGHGGGSGESAEEFRSDHVDAHVRALGGEDGGDEELEGRGVMERALDFGVGFVENFQDFGDPLGVGGFGFFEGGHGLILTPSLKLREWLRVDEMD